MGLNGFIQDPATKETELFHRDATSWIRDLKVFVDTGEQIPVAIIPPDTYAPAQGRCRGAVEGIALFTGNKRAPLLGSL